MYFGCIAVVVPAIASATVTAALVSEFFRFIVVLSPLIVIDCVDREHLTDHKSIPSSESRRA